MDSYREIILETVRLTLDALIKGAPTTDPYPWAFSSVVRGALPASAHNQRLVGAVIPSDERKQLQPQFVQCFLPIIIDFRFTVNKGDDTPAVEAERIIALIQRCLLGVRTLNGLCIDTFETGNAVDLETSGDKSVEGAVFFETLYRHDLDDPRKYFGVAPPSPTVATV